MGKVTISEIINGYFKRHKIKGQIACAVSGGVDSLAMVYLLAQSHDVIAVIVDHGLRKESAREAKQAARVLSKLKIKNIILSEKNTIKANLQEEARKLRYKLLFGYCRKRKIKYLATAHHAEDNAETFLLRLSRGSGLDGLTAIPEIMQIDGINVIRPVLALSKAQLRQVLEENKIKWVEDPTNKTDKYKRNSLRHALDKLEDRELITSRINDAAANLARVRNFIEAEVEKAFKLCVTGKEKHILLDIKQLNLLHEEIAYRVLVKVIMEISPLAERPRFEKLKRLKTDISEGKTRTLNGLIFRHKAGKVSISLEK